MSKNAISLASLAKRLETCQGHEFQTILRTLRSSSYQDEQLLKSDLAVFMAKVLKLVKSNDKYMLWKGCHLVNVVCSYNAIVLCSFSGELLTALYSNLEQKSTYYTDTVRTAEGRIILENLVRCIGNLVDCIRGKPTITREALTPKLTAIIPTLVSLAQYEPELCLPELKKLLYNNTTTFKPHVNKFRDVLTGLINHNYHSFNAYTKGLICDCFAYLHLVKKTAQIQDENQSHHKAYGDEHWREGLFSVLFQFKPVIHLLDAVLDFDCDADFKKLFSSLKEAQSSVTKADYLSPLSIDLNKPITLWDLYARLGLLTDLLSSFVSLPTPFVLRIPLGELVRVAEVLLSLSTNYLSFKRGLYRESDLTSTMSSLLPMIQFQGIRLLQCYNDNFGRSMLPYLPSILSSLEMFIPLKQKTFTIDFEKCELINYEIIELTKLVNSLAAHIGHRFNEQTLLIKLVDLCLYLLEDQCKVDKISTKSQQKGTEKLTNSKKKDKRNLANGTLSDIYSHPHLFTYKTKLERFDVTNIFFSTIITNWKIPSTQQVNIVRYCIRQSLMFKESTNSIPDSFAKLLTVLVLFPGSERISILPIAVRLLKDSGSAVFDVLCNPRLPVQMVQMLTRSQIKSQEEDELSEEGSEIKHEEEEEEEEEITTTQPPEEDDTTAENPSLEGEHYNGKREIENAIDQTSDGNSTENSMKMFKRSSETDYIHKKPIKRFKSTEAVDMTATTVSSLTADAESPAESDSEFEMPEIDLGDDED
ncbi:HEL323Wp [Eremothecium sinecaudum]|uniref:Pre-rRNA-processing protein RIX1 n=1 Tax=Eremothecium sinecaudum TaxID=45286 RepID=A0A120K2A7_9SACH|nr:HEL323Wp [Eremothecium sinecaudum]AMD20958.1 HEL323Wp [Eremothecium sinecaudum]